MNKRVNVADLLDASEVAEVLGLNGRNGVSVYARRHDDFPDPGDRQVRRATPSCGCARMSKLGRVGIRAASRSPHDSDVTLRTYRLSTREGTGGAIMESSAPLMDLAVGARFSAVEVGRQSARSERHRAAANYQGVWGLE